MDWLKDYIFHLSGAAILGGILTSLSPGKRMEKPFKLIVSLFMILIILSSFSKINKASLGFLQNDIFGSNKGDEQNMDKKLWEDTARITEKALSGSVRESVQRSCGVVPYSVTARVTEKADTLELAELTIRLSREDGEYILPVKEHIKKAFGIDAKVFAG